MEEHELDCRRCVDQGLRPVGQMIHRNGGNQVGLYEESELCRRCFDTLAKARKEAAA